MKRFSHLASFYVGSGHVVLNAKSIYHEFNHRINFEQHGCLVAVKLVQNRSIAYLVLRIYMSKRFQLYFDLFHIPSAETM